MKTLIHSKHINRGKDFYLVFNYMVVEDDTKSYPEELYINDLYKIHRRDIYKEQYLVGTKVKKDRKIINVQEMTLDKTLLRELRDRLNKMSLD